MSSNKEKEISFLEEIDNLEVHQMLSLILPQLALSI